MEKHKVPTLRHFLRIATERRMMADVLEDTIKALEDSNILGQTQTPLSQSYRRIKSMLCVVYTTDNKARKEDAKSIVEQARRDLDEIIDQHREEEANSLQDIADRNARTIQVRA